MTHQSAATFEGLLAVSLLSEILAMNGCNGSLSERVHFIAPSAKSCSGRTVCRNTASASLRAVVVFFMTIQVYVGRLHWPIPSLAIWLAGQG